MSEIGSTGARTGRHTALLPGLILGFLLTLFVAVFGYVSYQFLAWGQTALAQVPEMPPLELPQIVRAAPASDTAPADAPVQLFQAGKSNQANAPAATEDRITILLMGVDARPGQTATRTDSIILMTLDPNTGAAGMLSIPRDLKLRPSSLNSDVKINMVHPIGEARIPGGGPDLLVDAVEELVEEPVDYWVRINFDGFKGIIDLIGGVDINVTREIYDDKYPDNNYGYEPPVHFLPGLQHMDGDRALKYARTRHADSDYFRAARQQQVILAVKDRLLEPGQLEALLPRLPRLALAMANSVQTDMPVDRAITLARMLNNLDLDNVTRVVIDNKLGKAELDPTLGYVLIADMAKVRAAVDAVFAVAAPGVAPEETERQAVQAESARVVILNGTLEKGLAAKTQNALMTAGYNVVAVGNADRGDYAESWLLVHGESSPATRDALARLYQIPYERIRTVDASDTADLTLIVGEDQMQPAEQASVG